MRLPGSNAQGTLYLVGLGPGTPDLLAPGAAAALEDADVVVGFRGYMGQIASLTEGKEIVSMELGQELERASRAVDMAYAGSRGVRIVRGAGVYGMAGRCFAFLLTGTGTERPPGYSPSPVFPPCSPPRHCWGRR